jgi:hypothetical protein
MARYNEILVGRYNRFMQKLFGMKGGPPAPQLASEIAPAFPLFSGAENRYLEGWNTFMSSAQIAANVAQNGQLRIRNPAASNVIAVIEKIQVGGTNAIESAIKIGIGGTQGDLGAVQNGVALDSRGNANSSMIVSTSNVAVFTGVQIWDCVAPANTMTDALFTDMQELPLVPGSFYAIGAVTVNQLVIINIKWRERFLEDSERT